MAFITSGNQVISFADSNDVEQRDQRLFNENEGLSVDVIEDLLIRSSTRILNLLRNTSWWKESTNSFGLVAAAELDANLIVSRLADFTDLCVYHSMYEYILPLKIIHHLFDMYGFWDIVVTHLLLSVLIWEIAYRIIMRFLKII